MAFSATEQRRFGLAKESVRGTAEAAPTKWYPVLADTEFEYSLKHLKDDAVRGIIDEYPQIAGTKLGEGKVKMALDAQTAGEFFYSLLGSVSSAQQGVTVAYKHTISRNSSSISRPAYTFFLDRGMNVLKYNLGVVKKLTLNGPVDGLVMMDADIIFKAEASGSIGTPAFPTSKYMTFQHATVKLGGSTVSDVKQWQLTIDNGSQPFRALTQSQDISDVLVRGKQMVSGSMVVFFQAVTERDKFMANTTNTLQLLIEHDIIASTYKYTVDINLYKIQYTAFPYGEEDGLLAAKVEFKGVYSASDTKTLQVDVTNADTAY